MLKLSFTYTMLKENVSFVKTAHISGPPESFQVSGTIIKGSEKSKQRAWGTMYNMIFKCLYVEIKSRCYAPFCPLPLCHRCYSLQFLPTFILILLYITQILFLWDIRKYHKKELKTEIRKRKENKKSVWFKYCHEGTGLTSNTNTGILSCCSKTK